MKSIGGKLFWKNTDGHEGWKKKKSWGGKRLSIHLGTLDRQLKKGGKREFSRANRSGTGNSQPRQNPKGQRKLGR